MEGIAQISGAFFQLKILESWKKRDRDGQLDTRSDKTEEPGTHDENVQCLAVEHPVIATMLELAGRRGRQTRSKSSSETRTAYCAVCLRARGSQRVYDKGEVRRREVHCTT